MEIFINAALTNGINDYTSKTEKHEYNLSHVLELKIVEILVHLYGEINILNPYRVRKENSFKTNLMIDGASIEDIDRLFDLLNEYNNWLNDSSQSKVKNNIVKDIFEIIAKLVILKDKAKKISEEEMRYYQNFFNLNDNKIAEIVYMSAENVTDVRNAWNVALANSEEPEAKGPEFLSAELYLKHGTSIEEVSKWPKDKIEEVNAAILKFENDEVSGGTTKEKPYQLVLTSGSGFIDVLVLLSIICTEIMIGIIITVMVARLK